MEENNINEITPEEEKQIKALRLKKRIGIGVLALTVVLILFIVRLVVLIG